MLSFPLTGGDHAPLCFDFLPSTVGLIAEGKEWGGGGVCGFATVWYTSISVTPELCFISVVLSR